MSRPVALASDHAGFPLKEIAKEILGKLGIPTEDFGTHSEDSVDYPDFAKPALASILNGRKVPSPLPTILQMSDWDAT